MGGMTKATASIATAGLSYMVFHPLCHCHWKNIFDKTMAPAEGLGPPFCKQQGGGGGGGGELHFEGSVS